MLLIELARALQAPVRRRATTAELTHEVGQRLHAAGTELILVDDFNLPRNTPDSPSLMADTLTYLCDQLPATFVFAGQFLVPPAGPLARCRLQPRPLSPLAPGPAWDGLVARAEEALRLRNHPPGTLPDLAGHLHELTAGTALRLGQLVRGGAIRAIHDGTERITASLLDELSVPWQGVCKEPLPDN
jgi:hypothetical protein